MTKYALASGVVQNRKFIRVVSVTVLLLWEFCRLTSEKFGSWVS